MIRNIFVCTIVAATASFATGGTIADQIYPGLIVKVDAASLGCYPGHPSGDFPVAGDVTLRLPRLNDYTELEHFPQLSRLTVDEDCAFLPATLAAAEANQGFLTMDLRVVLRDERVESDDQCRLDLVETASVEIAGRILTSERRVSRPCN